MNVVWPATALFGAVLGVRIEANGAESCFMVRIAMLRGFASAYPVNWRQTSSGARETMQRWPLLRGIIRGNAAPRRAWPWSERLAPGFDVYAR